MTMYAATITQPATAVFINGVPWRRHLATFYAFRADLLTFPSRRICRPSVVILTAMLVLITITV